MNIQETAEVGKNESLFGYRGYLIHAYPVGKKFKYIISRTQDGTCRVSISRFNTLNGATKRAKEVIDFIG